MDVEFLAALPDDMRAEVLRDHVRQRPPPPAAAAAAAAPAGGAPAAAAASAPGVEPLDEEFLAALPPDLQAEILQQHAAAVRAAAAATQSVIAGLEAAAGSAAPAAPAAAVPQEQSNEEFLRSLNPSLRQQVLADADDTVIASLPADLAEEARRLRSERNIRIGGLGGGLHIRRADEIRLANLMEAGGLDRLYSSAMRNVLSMG